MRNLVPNLVYAARGDEVDYVLVNGQVIVEHGRVLTVDAEATFTDRPTPGRLSRLTGGA
jgi:5-methylthioadenosine/S-adenosylhomocysteine deaminase